MQGSDSTPALQMRVSKVGARGFEGSRFGVWGLGCTAHGLKSGVLVWSVRFRVWGVGVRDVGLGFRV